VVRLLRDALVWVILVAVVYGFIAVIDNLINQGA
jgi:hypothetical protein